jgi:hypothetical protein
VIKTVGSFPLFLPSWTAPGHLLAAVTHQLRGISNSAGFVKETAAVVTFPFGNLGKMDRAALAPGRRLPRGL